MNVDVNVVERHQNIEHEHRISSLHQKFRVRFFGGSLNRLIINCSSVDDNRLIGSVRFNEIHFRRESRNLNAPHSVIRDFDKVIGGFCAVH